MPVKPCTQSMQSSMGQSSLPIAGVLKEVLTVAASAALFGDELTPLNAAGLALCMLGIAGYHRIRLAEEA